MRPQLQANLRTRDVLPAVVAFVLTACMPAAVAAHAEEPNSKSIFALEDGWVLRANVGIVQSTNARELICEESFLGGDNWLLGALGPNEFVTFGHTAVMRTEDGCRFEEILELERTPSDATVHVASGGAAFIMNGVGEANGLYLSTDRGQSFALAQPFDAASQTTGLRYIDGSTLLVSGYDRNNNGAGLAWTVEVATGATTPVELPDGITYPYVLAASSQSALILGRRGEQVVFWGPLNDLEQNEFVASTWPSAAVLSADGQTAWIAGTDGGRGVARGTLVGSTATWETLAAETTAACVEPVGDDLFICGVGRFDEFDVLRVDPLGAVLGVLDFREFQGVRSDCPADSEVGRVCPVVWRELAPYFGIDLPPLPDAGGDGDAGESDAGEPSAPNNGPPPGDVDDHSGCCRTAQSSPTSPLGLSICTLLAILGVAGRRRR